MSWPQGTTGDAYGGPPPPDGSKYQRVLNTSWPPSARGIRDQRNPIKVDARIVWEHDGETWTPATAVRWTQQHVCVSIDDERLQVAYVWLVPSDVRRRNLQQVADAQGRADARELP